MGAKPKTLTATGHVVSHGSELLAFTLASDGQGPGRLVLYDAAAAASATTTNEVWRAEVADATGGSFGFAFSGRNGPIAETALYATLTNLNSAAFIYNDIQVS